MLLDQIQVDLPDLSMKNYSFSTRYDRTVFHVYPIIEKSDFATVFYFLGTSTLAQKPSLSETSIVVVYDIKKYLYSNAREAR